MGRPHLFVPARGAQALPAPGRVQAAVDRRKFVRAAVGTAVGVGAAGSAVAIGVPFLTRRYDAPPPRPRRYFGARIVGGPAPRGVPLIPLALNERGELVARAVVHDDSFGEVDTSAWHAYCDGAGPGGGDALRFFVPEERAAVVNPWYADRVGEAARPEDFLENEMGATVTWGAPVDGSAHAPLVAVVVRYSRDALVHRADATPRVGAPLSAREWALVRTRFVLEWEDSVFVAANAACTHFCCLAGFKENEKLARARDAWDKLFCSCHVSVFDPREPFAYALPAGDG